MHNKKEPLNSRIERVSELIKLSTANWLQVAEEVRRAHIELTPDEYQTFLTKTILTSAIADKLRKVSTTKSLYSDKFKRHLNRIDGWTTLYEIAKLKKSELNTFLTSLDAQPELNVSRETINSFRTSQSTPTNARSQNDKVSVCRIFISRADVQRLNYETFESIKTKLDEIKRLIDRSPQAVTVEINDTEIQYLEKTYFNTSPPDAESEPDIEDETLSDPQQFNQVSLSSMKESIKDDKLFDVV